MRWLQPVATVSFLGRDEVVIKGSTSIGGMPGQVCCTVARSTSISQWSLVPLRHEVVVVPDTALDGRCAELVYEKITENQHGQLRRPKGKAPMPPKRCL